MPVGIVFIVPIGIIEVHHEQIDARRRLYRLCDGPNIFGSWQARSSRGDVDMEGGEARGPPLLARFYLAEVGAVAREVPRLAAFVAFPGGAILLLLSGRERGGRGCGMAWVGLHRG